VVLGAGIAGLTAAQELSAAGFSVVVLEGRERIGGRLHTVPMDDGSGANIDLGAAWIHGLGSLSNLNAIYALALRFNLKMVPTDYDDFAIYLDDHRLDDAELAELNALYDEFSKFIVSLVARDPSTKSRLSIDAAVNLFASARGGMDSKTMEALYFHVHNYVESYWAGDGGQMAIGTMDEVRVPGDDVVLPGGYGQMVERLADGLDIRLNQVVQRVDWQRGESVLVTTSQGCFKGRRCLVTLPLGVLKANYVQFNPPLAVASPAKALAIQRLGTGVYNKVILSFDHAFWDNVVMLHRIPPMAERGRWAWIVNLHRVLGLPVLIGFSHGAFAVESESLTDEEIAEHFLGALRAMYPGKVPKPKKIICTRWGTDPFSHMSFTNIPVGASTRDCDILRQPIQNTLFFAGEATSRVYYGTVHGAYCTSLQAVADIQAADAAERAAAPARRQAAASASAPAATVPAAVAKISTATMPAVSASRGVVMSPSSGHQSLLPVSQPASPRPAQLGPTPSDVAKWSEPDVYNSSGIMNDCITGEIGVDEVLMHPMNSTAPTFMSPQAVAQAWSAMLERFHGSACIGRAPAVGWVAPRSKL